ncbi:MAG: hypothetical protein PHD82_05505 [Candidatus Riflebacteria bacterium]|nr:hypothetical protein [Candidatus Riflebacteria bacterium]
MRRTWLAIFKSVPVVALAAGSIAVMAGSLTPPAGPSDPASSMYYLEDIYNRLANGTPGARRTGSFSEPAGAPGSSMHNLNDIMSKAPAADTLGATDSAVLAGRKYWGLNAQQWGPRVGTMPNIGAYNVMPGVATVSIPAGYHDGSGQVSGDADLVAAKIADGTEIFGVAGTAQVAAGTASAAEVLSGKTFSNTGNVNLTGTMPNIGAHNVTPGAATATIPAGFHDGLGLVFGDEHLVSANIKAGTTIFGVSGNSKVVDTTSASALESQIASGATAWVNGQLVTGRMVGGVYVASTTGIWSAKRRWCNLGDGTVLDTNTGLLWDQKGTYASGTYYQAIALCNDHWRLPTLGELETTVSMWSGPVEYVTTSLKTQGIFLNMTTNWCWTCTNIASGVYQTVKMDTHDDGGVYPNLNNTMPQVATYTGVWMWRVRSAW